MQEWLEHQFTCTLAKETIRELCGCGIVDKKERDFLLECISARNISVHAYNETMACELVEKIPSYNKTMHTVILRVQL